MAIAIVQHTNGQITGATPQSLTITATGSGNLLVAAVLVVGTTPSSISDGTSTFTQFPSARITASGTFVGVVTDWYYLTSSNSGKTAISLTCAATTDFAEMEVWEISGITPANVATDGTNNNTTGGGTASGTTASGTITTTGSVGVALAQFGASDHFTGAAGGNQFTDAVDTPGDGWAAKISSAAATYTASLTDATSGDTFLVSLVAFKDTSAGGGSDTLWAQSVL